METGAGDRLARGEVSVTYGASTGKVTQKQWESAFEGWNFEEFMKDGKNAKSGNKERTRI